LKPFTAAKPTPPAAEWTSAVWPGVDRVRLCREKAMHRLRSGGTQVIRVERIEVSAAQAIIGNINMQR
jgi:hypothetical protein